MAGIFAYIGTKKADTIILESLKRLRFKSYDSCGLSIIGDSGLVTIKKKGKLEEIEEEILKKPIGGTIGIGHTRWATKGIPSEKNAHPHLDCSGNIAIVHNGVVENYLILRKKLVSEGHTFQSETDSEVIVHLIEKYYKGNLTEATKEAVKEIEGSYAIIAISANQPNIIVVTKKESPLIVGISWGQYFISSDMSLIIPHSRSVLIIEDEELGELSREGYKITKLDNTPVQKTITQIEWNIPQAERNGYEDFMVKEIHEQPLVVRDIIKEKQSKESIILDEVKISKEQVKLIDKAFILLSESSYYTGLMAKYIIETYTRIPADVSRASEFKERKILFSDKSLILAISESGDENDILASIKLAKKQNAIIICLSNLWESIIYRESDISIFTHIMPEIGVVATKLFSAQIIALYYLAIFLGMVREIINQENYEKISDGIKTIPEIMMRISENTNIIEDFAMTYHKCSQFILLGRGIGYPIALNGAYLLRKIASLQAQGYLGDEIENNEMEWVNKKIPLIALVMWNREREQVLKDIEQIKAKGSPMLAIAVEGDEEISKLVESVFYIPYSSEILSIIPAVIPLQFLAYYLARKRGYKVEQSSFLESQK